MEQDDEGIVPESLREVACAATHQAALHDPELSESVRAADDAGAARGGAGASPSEHDFLVIEDDPYGELVYVDGADTTPMKSRDARAASSTSDRSRKCSRRGCAAAGSWPRSRSLEQLEIAKQAADLCSGMLDQSIVDEFCAGGELPPQIEKVRAFYRGKRGVMIAALERALRRHARRGRRPTAASSRS